MARDPADDPKWQERERQLRNELRDVPSDVRERVLEDMLRDEIALEQGSDPAVAEAVALVRRHGLRRARKVATDPDLRELMGRTGLDVDRADRVARALEEYRAGLPWWRRLLS